MKLNASESGPTPTTSSPSQQEQQAEWDQIHNPSPAADPFPFHHDAWYNKATVLTIVFLPLLALGYVAFRFWGNHVSALDLWLLFGFWAFTGLGSASASTAC
jgi:hypothetical protein